MNYKNWSTKKFWIIAVVALFTLYFFGYNVGKDSPEPTATQSTTETKTVTKEVKVADTEAIDKLDDIDRQVFAASAEVIKLQSESLGMAGKVLSNFNSISVSEINTMTASIQKKADRIGELTDDIKALTNKRDTLLLEVSSK